MEEVFKDILHLCRSDRINENQCVDIKTGSKQSAASTNPFLPFLQERPSHTPKMKRYELDLRQMRCSLHSAQAGCISESNLLTILKCEELQSEKSSKRRDSKCAWAASSSWASGRRQWNPGSTAETEPGDFRAPHRAAGRPGRSLARSHAGPTGAWRAIPGCRCGRLQRAPNPTGRGPAPRTAPELGSPP